jgi:hypothetical protein
MISKADADKQFKSGYGIATAKYDSAIENNVTANVRTFKLRVNNAVEKQALNDLLSGYGKKGWKIKITSDSGEVEVDKIEVTGWFNFDFS